MTEETKTKETKIKETKIKETKTDFGIKVEDMIAAGVYFGHRISKCHPKMKPYISGVKGSDHINIIDLEKTKELLIEALSYIQTLMKEKKVLLLVGAKLAAKKLVQEIAIECGLPYVSERWLGGTFTNFKIIKKRIDYFKDLEKQKKEGGLEKYTKKEQLDIDKELEGFEQKFGGIKDLEQLPDAVFIIDMKKEIATVREAKKTGVPMIAVADTNVNPELVDYPIPANDDAISSVKYILEKIKEVILNVKGKIQNAK